MIDGMTGIKNELGRLLSQGVPEILDIILKDVGGERAKPGEERSDERFEHP